ncbi:MAG: ABC transporter permease, partial [Acidobacteriaceae bacterium]|nr:ABC transporter permease [Acidobacteriaceae bacterium]
MMRSLQRFFQRLNSWRKTREYEERLQAEIEEHLALQTEENVRAGWSLVEARRQAALKFGAAEAIKEEYREERGFLFFETLWQDARHTLRRLRKAPTFTVTTVLTLALGIGATTSIFTLAYAVLFKSLAVAHPDELYRLGKSAQCCSWNTYSQGEWSMISYELYKQFRDHTPGFAELAAFQAGESQFGVQRAGDSEPAQSYGGEFVSGNYFAMFGLPPYAGRMLTTRDDRPGAPATAVMSYRLWKQRYQADPTVIGSVFAIDGKPFTVVGVTPPVFFGDRLRSNPPDFYLPLHAEPALNVDANLNRPNGNWLDVIGRVKPDVNAVSLEAQMRVELKQWLQSHGSDMSANDRAVFSQQTLFLRPGGAGITFLREQYEHWLQILMLVAGFVLLIVCANVANLMLVRGMERRQQTSLSMALGAPVRRLVRQALTESILLALLGGAAGLLVAFIGTRLILHFAFPTQNGMAGIPINASPSGPVLWFAFVVSSLTGVAFGMAPAWLAARANPMDALRGAGRSVGLTSTARTGSLSRKALVVFQAALSLVLLSASGLLTVVLYRLEHQNFGVDQNHRLVASANPRSVGYRPDQLTPLYRRIYESLANIPGVSAVALCSYVPLSSHPWGADIWIEGRPLPGPRDNNFA